ncbi:MAG TPA: hypothetical protein VJA25_06040, partial [Dehalococcoidia bacterium]|nr:hypothetical protein [Dehalococcoidia bacterium]
MTESLTYDRGHEGVGCNCFAGKGLYGVAWATYTKAHIGRVEYQGGGPPQCVSSSKPIWMLR